MAVGSINVGSHRVADGEVQGLRGRAEEAEARGQKLNRTDWLDLNRTARIWKWRD